MALRIAEFFGYSPTDASSDAQRMRDNRWCPFLDDECTKRFHDGEKAGGCTLKPATSDPVISCPNRLYGNNYRILQDVSGAAFGVGMELKAAEDAVKKPAANVIAVFGKRWGGEVRLPARGSKGNYFVDWILARLNAQGMMQEFVAVEVQSIDTTGNYRNERDAYLRGDKYEGNSPAGLNWENVSKRILPQVIYKGHVLRREPLCTKGMFFVCPKQVHEHIQARLGGRLMTYGLQSGALTFAWYDVGSSVPDGHIRNLEAVGTFTTTVDQIALAFTSPGDLPPARVYEETINERLTLAKKLP